MLLALVEFDQWTGSRGFVVWEGFADDEYQFSPTEGEYFLWVGACGWFRDKVSNAYLLLPNPWRGSYILHTHKGLGEFQDLARNHPDKKFVVHCSGETTNLYAHSRLSAEQFEELCS
jgi:hypothetical protein